MVSEGKLSVFLCLTYFHYNFVAPPPKLCAGVLVTSTASAFSFKLSSLSQTVKFLISLVLIVLSDAGIFFSIFIQNLALCLVTIGTEIIYEYCLRFLFIPPNFLLFLQLRLRLM